MTRRSHFDPKEAERQVDKVMRPKRAEIGEPKSFLESALKYDGDECLLWPYATTTPGYAEMRYLGKTAAVHVLVCEFTNGGNPGGMEAAHSCGVRRCIAPKHLRWATSEQNNGDKITHGTSLKGSAQPMSKLTEKDIPIIRSLAAVESRRTTADRFGISPSTVSRIVSGNIWGWLKNE